MNNRKKRSISKKKLIIYIVAIVLTVAIAIGGIVFIANYDSCNGDDAPTTETLPNSQNQMPSIPPTFGDEIEGPLDILP